MEFLDNDTLLYIAVIIIFLAFFLWNKRQTKKNREDQKNRNFRKRYHEKRNRRNR
ncbi:hypothetical protein [Salinimicrobium gaetbulicola]|uniref:LPXTG-motif cell wall-anchored protein n=1 Tax=Salinimicrobium gaetbulicola TaxID=999702 RepID=A0ABW3IKS0_9FLAO